MGVRVSPDASVGRKIKAHKKSRNGCANCKLRSVKCDEGKPGCKRCTAYGVSCSYKPSNGSDLQVAAETTTLMEQVMINVFLPQAISYWPSQSEELIDKFQSRTALTVTAGKRLELYQTEILSLAYSNAYLMHAIKAMTLMHDRNLMDGPLSLRSGLEADHWAKALKSFNQQLSRPLESGHQVALWTTAGMLGQIVFYNVDATTPYEAWPLRPPSLNDLDWVKMNDGKKNIYELTQSVSRDPLYNPLFAMYTGTLLSPSFSPPDFSNLPAGFDILFNLYDSPYADSDMLDSSSIGSSPTDLENPYSTALISLARIYNSGCPFITTILTFWCFINDMNREYRQLLALKDPRALLLLAFWFMEVYETTVWWLVKRSKLEGMAICLYLEQFHAYDVNIVRLIRFPKAVFEGGAGGRSVATHVMQRIFSL